MPADPLTVAPVRTSRWWALVLGHRVPAAVAVALLSAVALAAGPRSVPLPAVLAGSDARGVFAAFCAWGLALAATQLTAEPAAELAATSPRGWFAVRLVRLVAAAGAVAALGASCAPGGLREVTASAVLTLTAEGLVAARWAGAGLAWTLPTAHLGAAIVFGPDRNGDFQSWAWFLDSTASATEVGVLGTVAVAAAALWARGPAYLATERLD